MTMTHQLKFFFFSLALMGSLIFFSLNSIMNVEYEGAEQGSSYVYFSIFVFLVVFCFTILDIKLIKRRFFLFSPLILTFLFLIEYPTAQNAEQSELMNQSLKYFWAFTVPCLLVGADAANTGGTTKLFKWVDVWSFVIALGCVVALPRLLLSRIVQFGGGNYQLLSYASAFVASILLYNLLNDNRLRFSILKNKLVAVISVLLIAGCVLCIFGSGGRGGFLLLAVNSVILLYSRRKWILRHSFALILIVVLIVVFFSFFDSKAINVIYERGASRIIESFFSSDESFVSKSGREEVYAKAFNMIRANPFGYGFFRAYAIGGNYPHNIFLEIILDGGYLLLLFFLVIGARIIRKFNTLMKTDVDLKFVLLLFSYPLIMLQFTSTYLWTGIFWFCVAFVMSCRINLVRTEQTKFNRNDKDIE